MTDIAPFELDFIRESNAIEGIHRDPTDEEVQEYLRFISLDRVKLADLETFVSVYQSGAKLRMHSGMNVRVGGHLPPPGGLRILYKLNTILDLLHLHHPYHTHQDYEFLHPFMDGNGRSGRMLWMWQMMNQGRLLAPLGFLQTFYYQSLDADRDVHKSGS